MISTKVPPRSSEQVLEQVHAQAAGVPVLALGHAPPGPSVPGRLHKLHGLVGEGSLHVLDGGEEGQHVFHLVVLQLTSAGGADHPLVAVLHLKGGESLQSGQVLLLLSRPLASPGEQVGAEQLGLDAEQADGGEGGGLGGGEGEEGGGAGDGGDGEGAGGGGHLVEQDQAQGEGRKEEGAEHLSMSMSMSEGLVDLGKICPKLDR